MTFLLKYFTLKQFYHDLSVSDVVLAKSINQGMKLILQNILSLLCTDLSPSVCIVLDTLECCTKGKVVSSCFGFTATPPRGPSAAELQRGLLTREPRGTTAGLNTECSGSHLIALIRDSSGRSPSATSSAFSISAKVQVGKRVQSQPGEVKAATVFPN